MHSSSVHEGNSFFPRIQEIVKVEQLQNFPDIQPGGDGHAVIDHQDEILSLLNFAEKSLNGITLLGITEKEIQLKRKEVAHTLMMFEGQMEGCCPCCGFITKPDEEPLVQCKKCRKLFHKKSLC